LKIFNFQKPLELDIYRNLSTVYTKLLIGDTYHTEFIVWKDSMSS